MATKKRKMTFQVKLKLSINGYKNKFYEGLAMAYNETQACDLSVDYVTEKVKTQLPEELADILKVSVVRAQKLKDQFIVNAEKIST